MAPEPSVSARAELLAHAESFGNDLPTYRALSALAITSAAAGLLSGLSFVSWSWLVLAVLAVVAGVAADLRIRKMPDILTGRSFAHAGIAMGLIFGVTATSYGAWTTYNLKNSALKFAREFAVSLNEAAETQPLDTSGPIWYMMPPGMKNSVSKEEAKVEMAKMLKNSDKAHGIDETIKQMLRYAGPGNPIVADQAEKISIRDDEVLVSVLLKVGDGRPMQRDARTGAVITGAGDHDHDHAKPADPKAPPERASEIIGEGSRDHALVLVRGTDSGRKIHWFVDQIQYPYKPKSFTPVATKKVEDDGHGHGH